MVNNTTMSLVKHCFKLYSITLTYWTWKNISKQKTYISIYFGMELIFGWKPSITWVDSPENPLVDWRIPPGSDF